VSFSPLCVIPPPLFDGDSYRRRENSYTPTTDLDRCWFWPARPRVGQGACARAWSINSPTKVAVWSALSFDTIYPVTKTLIPFFPDPEPILQLRQTQTSLAGMRIMFKALGCSTRPDSLLAFSAGQDDQSNIDSRMTILIVSKFMVIANRLSWAWAVILGRNLERRYAREESRSVFRRRD
jgi:hypothetical protein